MICYGSRVMAGRLQAAGVRNVTVRGSGIVAAEWLPGGALPFTCHHCGCPGDVGIFVSNSSDVMLEGFTLAPLGSHPPTPPRGALPYIHAAVVAPIFPVSRPSVCRVPLGMRSVHPHKWHLCGWIERIPVGTRQNDGLETGNMGATAARLAWTPARQTVPLSNTTDLVPGPWQGRRD